MHSPGQSGNSTESPISHSRMNELRTQGQALQLSQYIQDHVYYQERWWIADRDGWHLVIDQALHEMLDVQRKWAAGNIYIGSR